MENQVCTVGCSRERTHLYDLGELVDNNFEYTKAHEALRLGATDGWIGSPLANLSHVSLCAAYSRDMPSWNHDTRDDGEMGMMAGTTASLNEQFSKLGICHNDTRALAMMLPVEALYPSWSLYSPRWRDVATGVFDAVGATCSLAHVIHKTTTATRVSARALTWQRMYAMSRVAETVAAVRGLPTLDAFVMTQPWILDAHAFPDTMHNYRLAADSTMTLAGNFISHTITQLLLQMACTDV